MGLGPQPDAKPDAAHDSFRDTAATSCVAPTGRRDGRARRPDRPQPHTARPDPNKSHPPSSNAAAGIAWERTLTTRIDHLGGEHDQLHVIAERWKPPGVRLDLDLILADDTRWRTGGVV